MARSQKDDTLFNDIHQWNYCSDKPEPCTAGKMNEGNSNLPSNTGVANDCKTYPNTNPFSNIDVYNNVPYSTTVPPADNSIDTEGNIAYSNNRLSNLQNYAMLKLGNGQMVRMIYDENNQQFMIPVSGQYELFNQNQNAQQTLFYPTNQNYNSHHIPQSSNAIPEMKYNNDNTTNVSVNQSTSSFLKDVLGNWEPNVSGTYSPFGQNFPLNHPEAPTLGSSQNNHVILESNITPIQKLDSRSPKRNENSPLAETTTKKRIVAEVKPMRPSYSDVLAKNMKNTLQPEPTRKVKIQNNNESKNIKPNGVKSDKFVMNNIKPINDDNKQKFEKKPNNNPQISSGSDSGDINVEENCKQQKTVKKNKNKKHISRKWSSLEDLTTTDDSNFMHEDSTSQFVFIENRSENSPKKEKKGNDHKNKTYEKSTEDYAKMEIQESDFVFQESTSESIKSRKKKESRGSGHKPTKTSQDKKKGSQSKWRRGKPKFMTLIHHYLENWFEAVWKALIWFFYLLSDICCMSAHLSFDLCASTFTHAYVSSQAVWRSSKEWLLKLQNNKYFMYIDRKLGHTKLGFWRKFKCFKKETEVDDTGDATKLNSNIPLPGTGDEAMKRLLACKGKDPYSILGVNENCSDEDIKRYYRRQAFLVHPDKNQQPGAEEAFKILQHAFDLIGEPYRREDYDRRALESRYVDAAWSELSQLLAQLHDKMEFAANTIRCTNCGRRHKRVLTDRPCYAARYCAQCKIRHSAKEGDIWAESSMMGLLVMYYACMDGAVYQITQWASCQKKNLKQLKPDCHVVQYRIVLGNKACAAPNLNQKSSGSGHDPNLEEFLNNLYNKSGTSGVSTTKQPTSDCDGKTKRRNKKSKM